MRLLDRLLGRQAAPELAVRRYDGATTGRRAPGLGTFGAINAEVAAAGPTVRPRARHLAQNNPWLFNATSNLVGALVGASITPTARHPDPVMRAALGDLFDAWSEDCDADGRADFAGLLADMARALVVDGEALFQIIDTPNGPLLRHLPAELLSESETRELPGGGMIVSGVEFDTTGVRVAYWIHPTRPASAYETWAPPVRVPASEILHVFRPLAAGQVRGISWLAPVILSAVEFDQLLDALLVGAKVSAMHAGFMVDQNGAGEPFDGEPEVSLEPGVVRRLPAGFDIRFNTPAAATETHAFIRTNLQQLAAGLGLPEHLLSGDLTGANYSSLRAGLLPFRQRVEQIQYGVLVPQLLRPVWRRVVAHAILSGEIAAPDYEANPRAYGCEWLPPKPLQVDPLKDTEATVAEIAAGLTSRRKAVAERGWDADALDLEIAADRERAARLGLSFGASAKEESRP